MTTLDQLTETERLLLMAAAVHGLGPEADIDHANTARVVGQALDWAGLFDGGARKAWEALGEQDHSAIDRVYGALIRMTHEIHRVGPGRPPERPGDVMFEGGGNWGDPRGRARSGIPALQLVSADCLR